MTLIEKSANASQNPLPTIVADETCIATAIFQSFLEVLEGWGETIAEFFVPKTVKKLTQDPKTTHAAKTVLKKQEQRAEKQQATMAKYQSVLKQPISILEKIKSLVNIPKEISPYIDIFFAKGTNLKVDIGLEEQLTFSTGLNLSGVQGKVHFTLPTAPAQTADEMPIDLHPALKGLLGAKLSEHLSEGVDLHKIVDLLLTLPTQTMSVTYEGSKGTAKIILNLPSGAELRLELAIPKPADAKAQESTDLVRSFLKGVLKDNYVGIEPLLAETFTFIWDSATSQFRFNFPQQQALKFNALQLKGKGILQTLAAKISKDSTIVLPQTIAGKIDFKNPSIRFEPGTKLILQGLIKTGWDWFDNLLDKDIDINHVSYDVEKKTVFLSIDCAGNHIIPINLDPPKNKPAKVEENEFSVEKIDFNFIPFTDPKPTRTPVKQTAEASPTFGPQQKQSLVVNQIKKLIEIPEAFASYVDMLFTKGTKLEVDIDIQDNIVFKTDVAFPDGGITGRIALTAPLKPDASTTAQPVKMNDELLKLITDQLQSLGSEEDIDQLLAMLTLLPAQNIYVRWIGSANMAKIDLTLPGEANLHLDLILAKQDPKFEKSSNIVRSLLSNILKDNYKGIAPLLSQDYALTWTGSTKKFKVEFIKQQVVHLNSLLIKGEGTIKNFIKALVDKIIKGSQIVIPQEISGKIDFEKTSVTFDKGTKFVLKGLLPFDKEIDFDQVTFNPKDNAIALQIQCFGTHKATIDLNTSNVDKVDLGIRPVSRSRKSRLDLIIP